MRRHSLLTAALATAICLIIVGFVRGWIELSAHSTPGPKVNIQLTLDPDQVKKDAEKVKREADQLFDKGKL